MLTTTDVPLLAVQLMESAPWIRQRSDGSRNGSDGLDDDVEIYDNGQWRICSSDEASGSTGQLHPVAAHLWLLLLSLLMSPVAPRKYELNDFRCQQLLKVCYCCYRFISLCGTCRVTFRFDFHLEFHLSCAPVWIITSSIKFHRWPILKGGSSSSLWPAPIKFGVLHPPRSRLSWNWLRKWGRFCWNNWPATGPTSWISSDSISTMNHPNAFKGCWSSIDIPFTHCYMQCMVSLQHDRLAAIYDPEHLEATFNHCAASPAQITQPKTSSAASFCVLCAKQAIHRCSRCRRQHYCSK